jgi:hypothetical protein
VAAATTAATAATEDGTPDSMPLPPPRRATRVLVVSMDGLGASYLESMLADGALPTFTRLAERGAWTLNARTDFEVSLTLPNHTSMISGRPVTQVPGLPANVHHGYLANTLPAPTETVHNAGNPEVPYVASMFDVAHDRGYSTCLYAGKTKFVLFSQSYDAAHGAPDTVGKNDGPGKIDHFVIIEDRSLIDVAATELGAGRCDLSLLHVADLDTPLGHGSGWGSDGWRQGLIELDAALGSLLDRLEAAGDFDRWGLVLTADHGGEGTNHADATLPAVYRIPFFAFGPGIPAGVDLYELTAGRRFDPGDSRPGYDSSEPPLRNGDAGNLALELLGLPPVPGSLLSGLGVGG